MVEIKEKEEFEYVELSLIAETNNIGLIALAKSILNYASIKYYINDNTQSFIPGAIPFIQIRVPLSDAINAKELLKDIGL